MTSPAPTLQVFRATARLAAAFLLVALCWVFSNPPAAAPDESDHLVKALGNASGQLGDRPVATDEKQTWLQQRNASTTRVYSLPARLVPAGLTCFAFVPTTTAACQPEPSGAAGESEYPSSLGDYPAFLYVPIGAAASLADTPAQAFYLGRLVVVMSSVLLLWIGMAHLARWFGRQAVLAYAVLISPVAMFMMSSVSTSGIELAAAAGVAAVVTTCVLRPDVVHHPSTHWTFLATATVLALSRQLGVLALAVFLVVLLTAVGPGRVTRLVREHQPSFVVTVGLVGISAGAALWWERTYDHPAHVMSPLDANAFEAFLPIASRTLASAVGKFGWLDTDLPSPATGAWVSLWLVTIVMAALFGRSRETWTVLVTVALTLTLAVGVYMSAFYPIGAEIQGRHFLPLFSLPLVLAATILTRSPTRIHALVDATF